MSQQPRYFGPPQQFSRQSAPLPSEQSTRGSTTVMILGLVAFFTAWIPFLGVFALLPGIMAMQRGIAIAMQRFPGRGVAITGAVFGGLGSLNALWMPIVGMFVLPAMLTMPLALFSI